MPGYEGKRAEQVRRRAPLRGYGRGIAFAGAALLVLSQSAPAGALLLLLSVWALWEGRPSRRLIVSVIVTDHAIAGFTEIGDEFTVPWDEVSAVTGFWREERLDGRLLIGLELTAPGRRPIGLYRFVMAGGPLPVPHQEQPGLSDFDGLAAHIQAHTAHAVHRQGR